MLLLPPQAPEQMPAVYKMAGVLIFPTLEDVWGLLATRPCFPASPFYISEYAGCAESLRPGNIFDPEDPEDFFQKLSNPIEGALPVPVLCGALTPRLVADLAQRLNHSAGSPTETAADVGEEFSV